MSYSTGRWKVICDVCGFEFYNTEVRKRWDNLIVCEDDWETDHPQKYLRVRSDPTPVPDPRPEPEDIFIEYSCDVWTSSPMAGFGVAGCAYPGGNTSVERLIELYYPDTSCIADIAIASYSIPGVR